ncbi:hypothetical protein [Aquabacterium sp. OR-4]|uniref:hypothetical protein n=1 Tax=Aquabacterium sp. OR-4 TaxID=2978127 RepID=UPI0028C75ADB|nr:hypothetical protein [Aquabacterium sp. OR-4]MDT7836898.1 hypothetical protein [Aquabacterium sp. OR-4]
MPRKTPPVAVNTRASDVALLTVTKRLLPGRPGTKQHLQRYGAQLVCVRYRHDPEQGHRYTTVELLVDDGPLPLDRRSGPTVLLKVQPHEIALQQLLALHGNHTISELQPCLIPRALAIALGLQAKVIRKKRPRIRSTQPK